MRFNGAYTELILMFVKSGGSYIDGRFVEGSEVQSSIRASVQRLTMRERELLPEGFRASETLKIYTEIDNIKLIQNDEIPIIEAAEFEYKSKRYSMLASEEWDYLIPHWKITVVAKTDG
jgi:hypothetical protein